MIQVAAYVPVSFSGQYGGKFCAPYKTPFGFYDETSRPKPLPAIIGNEFRVLFVHECFLSSKLERAMFVRKKLWIQ
jgi:hypothetical protein